MKKLLLLLAACTVFVLSATAHAQDKLTVMLDWFVNPDHAPLILAQDLGYFRDAGLTVDLIAPSDPNDPPKLVAAGKADLAVTYQPELHLQVAAGLPLVRVGTLVSTPLNAVVVLANGPIKTLADLKGRKVGFSVGGFEDALLGAMLESVGLTLKDVTLINVNFTLSPALMSGQVDAVVGAFRNFELNQLAIEQHPGLAFYPEEHGVPAYDELILVAAKDKVADPRLPKFLDAIERATLFLLNHPDEARAQFVKGRSELDDELNRRAWAATLPRFTHSPAALDAVRYERFGAFLKSRGLIEKLPPISDYAVVVERAVKR